MSSITLNQFNQLIILSAFSFTLTVHSLNVNFHLFLMQYCCFFFTAAKACLNTKSTSLMLWNIQSWMIAQSSGESCLSTSQRSFEFKDKVEVICSDDRESMLVINKSAETDTADAALKDASWVNDEFVICADDNVAVWFNWDSDDEDDNKDKAQPLKVKCARTHCWWLVFVGWVRFLLIFINTWWSQLVLSSF